MTRDQDIPEGARYGLEDLIAEDIERATVSSCSPRVDERGRIKIDEMILRLPDKREVAIAAFWCDQNRDAGDLLVSDVSGWRPVTADEDYTDELNGLLSDEDGDL